MEGRGGTMGSGSSSAPVDPMSISAVRLLAFDLLSVQHHPGPQKGLVQGFPVDDGTGCVPCILWTNHYTSSYFAHWKESELELQARIAKNQAENVRLGCLLRVTGRLSEFRNQLQTTVLSLHEEKDPNAEVFHWLQCMKLALRCYDLPFPSLKGLDEDKIFGH